MLDDVVNRRPDLAHLHDWIDEKGGIVYSLTKQIKKEFVKSEKTKAWFNLMRAKGRANYVPEAAVEAEMKKLPKLQSNDHHIIALAKAAQAKLLATRDQGLSDDFKRECRGKIYKSDKNHYKLLRKVACRTQ